MRRLLIRPGAIGDCILSLPALAHLQADYTEVWVPSAVVSLIQFAHSVLSLASTGIDLLGIVDWEPDEKLRRTLRGFDEVVSWYGTNRPEFRAALESFGAPCQFYQALPPAEYTGHATDFFAQQVGAVLRLIPRIAVDARPRNTIVIHPFSGSKRKNWPLSSYRELASRLPCSVEWTAGPEEELPEATRFSNLLDLARWIRGARLYIGNDSGITHLAAATGVPTLALFGPTAPEVWGPRGENITVLKHDPIMELKTATVLRVAQELFGES
ncbi:MAG: glycosyltransferase family 9 protein [Acidobacteriaceae bacterium]|nr:glycosyltransferase family 9 protein [Acidobacteriaceae bacterium]MBV9307359.1 glycosyltransferase family 9 protein [Acidobacteriaceae bacterium]